MKKLEKTGVVAFFVSFCSLCAVIAQEKAVTERYVNPDRAPGVFIEQPVSAIFGSTYFYEIVPAGMDRSPVHRSQQIKPRRTRIDSEDTDMEERFITSEYAVKSPYTLYIQWDYKDDHADLCKDGEYVVKIYELSGWGKKANIPPRYSHKIVLDRNPNSFALELGTSTVSINAQGVLFARAVDKDTGKEVKASKWMIKVINSTTDELLQWDYIEAPMVNTTIPLQYGWYDYGSITEIGEYPFRLEVTNSDEAGNIAFAKAAFTVSYAADLLSSYRILNSNLQMQLQQAQEKISFFERTVRFDGDDFAFNSATGEEMKMEIAGFDGKIAVQGNYRIDTQQFSFNFLYYEMMHGNPVKNIEMDVYNEENQLINTFQSKNIAAMEWDGTDKAGRFILTSNTVYFFDVKFYDMLNNMCHAKGHMKTNLITQTQDTGELFVVLPGIYFPGYVSDVFRAESYLTGDIKTIWKMADLINRYGEKYESITIRGYANWTTYPKNGNIGRADKIRMDRELPALQNYSRQRAESVKALLVMLNVPEDKIRIAAMGPERRLADPNGGQRYMNRRVEFYLQPKA